MPELEIRETIICPKDSTEQETDFCRGCDYYCGTSLNIVDCRYGEQLIDKIAENVPLQDFERLKTDDYLYLVNGRKYLAFRLSQDAFEKEELERLGYIPEAEVGKEDFDNLFDVNFKELKPVEVSDYSYRGLRLIKIEDEISAINTEISWLWEIDINFDLATKSTMDPIYLIREGEVIGLIMPCRPGTSKLSKLKELDEFREEEK